MKKTRGQHRKKLSRAQKTTLAKPATAAYIEGKRQFLLDTNSAFLLDTNQLSTPIEEPRAWTPVHALTALPPVTYNEIRG